MKAKGTDYLVFDGETGAWRQNPEQIVRDEVERHYWKHVVITILKDWRLYLMLVPMILVFLFWRYFPMYELLGSFKVEDNVKPVAERLFLGFSNFKALLTGAGTFGQYSTEFWQAMRNTFLLSFYGLCFGFPMPIILALFFNEIRGNISRSILQVLTYLPKFMSTVIMTSLIIMLIKGANTVLETEPGILAQFLQSLGLISSDAANAGILRDPNYFSIVFFAAIIAIAPTSYEAAQIDGANKWAQMRYVVLPSILSTIVIMLITRIGNMLSIGYEKVILLTENQGNSVLKTAQVISTYSWAKKVDKPGIASAAEMLNNVVGMLLVIGANTIARRASNVSLY